MGRSAILGEQKDNEFCDVVCGRGEAADSTYAITRGGLLCEFNSRRLLDKWVELRVSLDLRHLLTSIVNSRKVNNVMCDVVSGGFNTYAGPLAVSIIFT